MVGGAVPEEAVTMVGSARAAEPWKDRDLDDLMVEGFSHDRASQTPCPVFGQAASDSSKCLRNYRLPTPHLSPGWRQRGNLKCE
jgi:hypothetical protein